MGSDSSPKLAVGDLIFDARLCGPEDGAVVVLLHGWPELSSWWRDSLEALGAAGYRAVAFDQRGYSRGARPLDVAEIRPDRLVDDVLGIANAIGAQSFHIVAHDWGGMVAWALATSHPQRLRVADRALDASLRSPFKIPVRPIPHKTAVSTTSASFDSATVLPSRTCSPTEREGCAMHSTHACRKILVDEVCAEACRARIPLRDAQLVSRR